VLAWTQMLGFPTHPARRWEPKRLRLRLFSLAGRLARRARRLTVSVIDTATEAVTVAITVGSSPVGLALTPEGRYAYVANNGSKRRPWWSSSSRAGCSAT